VYATATKLVEIAMGICERQTYSKVPSKVDNFGKTATCIIKY
jgi:hypothetical protein